MLKIICKCDICGAALDTERAGHEHWPCNMKLGYNYNSGIATDDTFYEDVCAECAAAISKVIREREQLKNP